MAKLKRAGSTKAAPPPSPHRGLIPCGLLVILALGLVFGLMYLTLDSAAPVPGTAPATQNPGDKEQAK